MSVLKIDSGLTPGNYFNFLDDEVAKQNEIETIDGWTTSYVDPTFPPDARSLYFDPLHPPKGALPGESIKWCSINAGEVIDCDAPVFCQGDANSCFIEQGALGDSYLVNALRFLSCEPKRITRLLVSDEHASRGIYTFKFYKAGRWRYVVVDDKIPCRQSGRVNFARNLNRNETFAMLLEKAYAKLHGCYEALIHGLVEKVVQDFGPAGHVATLRAELHDLDTICDATWSFLENALAEPVEDDRSKPAAALVTCGKFVPDPYCERMADRQGISVGHMYQVMDVVRVTALPTADLDLLTVGMVCVRNLQPKVGRFVGRWSHGHQLWTQYREIGIKLRHRTRELQFRRGLGVDPNEVNAEGEPINFKEDDDEEEAAKEAEKAFAAASALSKESKAGDEPDALGLEYIARVKNLSPQPLVQDLYWIQIEDYVDLFNRVYVLTDFSLVSKQDTQRFVSKWIPGDYTCGSGGPPLVLPRQKNRNIAEAKQLDDDLTAVVSLMEQSVGDEERAAAAAAALGGESGLDAALAAAAAATDAEATSAAGGGGEGGGGADAAEAATAGALEGAAAELGGEEVPDTTAAPTTAAPSSSPGREEEEGDEEESESPDDEDGPPILVNDEFADNPMYPFSVSEPTTLVITLYQEDRRWSVGRLGEDPRDIVSSAFASRSERLASCMKYGMAIGFVVCKLNGLKMRVTDFKLRKVVGASEELLHSNATSCSLTLRPGRYAIVPYTDAVVDEAEDYILHVLFSQGAVEFEVKDLLAERPQDTVQSDEDDSADEGDAEEGDDELEQHVLEAKQLERSRLRVRRNFNALLCTPPLLNVRSEWEFLEDTEEMGVVSVFDEVNDLSSYLNDLRGEMKNLRDTFKALQNFQLSQLESADGGGGGKPGSAAASGGGGGGGAKSPARKK